METSRTRWTAQSGWESPLPAWDGPATLVIAFGGSTAPEPALADLRAAFGHSVVVGCSSAGEILDDRLGDEGLVVAVTRFASTRLELETSPVTKERSADVGAALGACLRVRGDDLVAVLVLSDGLDINGSALAEGLTRGAGDRVVVTGGLAGDGTRFTATWVLVDGAAQPGHVTAVGLYGPDLQVQTGCEGGWSVLGPERLVTRSQGNELFEIDGQPALQLYKTYLGERASGLPATALLFPLGLRVDGDAGREVVRTVIAVDEEQQSLVFAGDVPQGGTVQLLRSTPDRLVEAAQKACAQTRPPLGVPALAIAVSCVGRRLYMGQRVEEELEVLVSELGPGCGLIGFYSYGELSPGDGCACALHNQTMTLTVLSELADGGPVS